MVCRRLVVFCLLATLLIPHNAAAAQEESSATTRRGPVEVHERVATIGATGLPAAQSSASAVCDVYLDAFWSVHYDVAGNPYLITDVILQGVYECSGPVTCSVALEGEIIPGETYGSGGVDSTCVAQTAPSAFAAPGSTTQASGVVFDDSGVVLFGPYTVVLDP